MQCEFLKSKWISGIFKSEMESWKLIDAWTVLGHYSAHCLMARPGQQRSAGAPTGWSPRPGHPQWCDRWELADGFGTTRSAPRAPASCGVAVEQGAGDGDAPWWRVIDKVAVFGGGGRPAADSSGWGVICQLGGRGKMVRRGLINDEMYETVELTKWGRWQRLSGPNPTWGRGPWWPTTACDSRATRTRGRGAQW
jgi:hypothetical protein